MDVEHDSEDEMQGHFDETSTLVSDSACRSQSPHSVTHGKTPLRSFQFEGKIFARNVGNAPFRILIFQGAEQLFIRGTVECRVVYGSLECFGYRLDGNYRPIVSSLVTELMSMESLPSSNETPLHEWYNRISSSGDSGWSKEDVSLGLKQFVSQLVRDGAQEVADSISAIAIVKSAPFAPQGNDLLKDDLITKGKQSSAIHSLAKLSTAILLDSPASDLRPILVPTPWRALTSAWHSSTPPTELVICGKKHVGKSTMMRFMVNSLLRREGKVCLLDLDLGQPELTAPGFISLSVLSKPMLGPSFSNIHLAPPDWQESHFVGTPNAKEKLSHIFDIAMILFSRYKYSGDKPFSLDSGANKKVSTAQKPQEEISRMAPIVVNTHGWIEGPGLQTLYQLVRAINPSHLVQILPDTDPVIFTNGDSLTSPPSGTSLHTLQPAYVHTSYNTIKATEKRIMQTMSAIGSERTTYRLPWSAFRIHILDAEVPPSQIMYVLNASIVALVVDSTEYSPIQQVASASGAPSAQENVERASSAHPVDPTLPIFLMEPPPYLSSYCVGIGVISSIDMEKRCFHLSTNVPRKLLLDVNTLIKGNIELPVAALMASATPSTPYLTADSANTEGGATLKVRNNLVRGKPT